jgi:hypothetical protein
MTTSYEAKNLTPSLEKELKVMLGHCEQDGNLKLAVDEFFAASNTKAAKATDDEIDADLSSRDAEWKHAALVNMIQSYRRLHRASAVLLLAIAEGHISARKKVASDAVREKLAIDPVQAAKVEAKTLWLERRNGMHRNLRTNDLFAAETVRRWPPLKISTVLKWCTTWEKEAKSTFAS